MADVIIIIPTYQDADNKGKSGGETPPLQYSIPSQIHIFTYNDERQGIIMKKPYTDPIYIGEGATERLYDFLRERFGDCADQGITVCDENTERFCYNLPR